jgi:uncharacterized membrane protein YphA (DoxX/SURF4 family)
MINSVFYWIIRLIPAVIMLQTLYFKFTAHPQSVKLFTILGMEPWGRVGIGVLELIASVLLLINRTVLPGALLGAGLMCGAIFFHITNSNIGINFDGDPILFIYAIITLACCLALIVIQRRYIKDLLKLKL